MDQQDQNQDQISEQSSNSVFTPGLAAMRSGEDAASDMSAASGGGLAAKRNIVVVGVLVLGVGMLYFMRQAGTGPRSANAEVEIDYEFTDAEAAQSVARQEEVIDDLRRAGPPAQLPADDLGKNPFMLSTIEVAGNNEATPTDEGRRERLVSDAVRNLRLQAVIDGRVPIARISGGTYRIGDRLGDYFEVIEIGGRAVVLKGPNREHRLEMSSDG